jgi:homoserine O-succinyltransferase/O-acetyltransferase
VPLRDFAATAPDALRRHGNSFDPLVVGLVNNMPDAALHSTERQFRRMISDAAGDLPIRLRLLYLPEVPRTDAGRSYVELHYETTAEVWKSRLDGLIVTGTEPRAADLRDEPYWAALTRLVDWAEQRTLSTVWSCLAAHAAVLHTDGIVRQALPGKLFGVFESGRIGDHAIVRDAAPRWRVAHSRYNGVPEAALAAHGYRLLSRSETAGPDLFIRQRESLFVYFQGHPEYDADSLAREYRRDVGRFLAGKRDDYPEMPCSYFDDASKAALTAFRRRTLRERSPGLLSSYPAVAPDRSTGASSEVAIGIYRQWLAMIAQEKSRRSARECLVEPLRSGIVAPIRLTP